MEPRNNLSEDKIYCMVYNSGLKCPPDCKFQHNPEQKRKVQKLFSLGLYVQIKTGLLRPKQEELNNFYNHLFANKICVKFYLLGDCPFVAGNRCWYHHISILDQKHQLLPKVPPELIKKDEDHQRAFTEWHIQKCRYGAFCQKKNMGCPFSHEGDTVFQKKEVEKTKKEGENKEEEEDQSSQEEDVETNVATEKSEKKTISEDDHKDEALSKKKETKEKKEECDEEEVESEEDRTECSKCPKKKKTKANCMFLPCGHRHFCMACAEKVLMILEKKCSLCFEQVEFVKIKN